jgi:hypothetical protein
MSGVPAPVVYVHSGFERMDRTIARYTNNSFAKNRLEKVGFCGRVMVAAHSFRPSKCHTALKKVEQ